MWNYTNYDRVDTIYNGGGEILHIIRIFNDNLIWQSRSPVAQIFSADRSSTLYGHHTDVHVELHPAATVELRIRSRRKGKVSIRCWLCAENEKRNKQNRTIINQLSYINSMTKSKININILYL